MLRKPGRSVDTLSGAISRPERNLPRSPRLHAGARGLCGLLQRVGLLDRQFELACGGQADDLADRAGNFGSAGRCRASRPKIPSA